MATQEIVAPDSQAHVTRAYTQERTNRAPISPRKLAKALGWFSLGLGITEIVAPRALAKVIGARGGTGTTRVMGLREVAAGVGLLSSSRPGPWLWARAAGDAADMAALVGAARYARSRTRLSAAMGAVAGVAVLDYMCAKAFTADLTNTHFTASVMINRSPEECYRYWRDIAKLPTFIDHLKSVTITDATRSHWVTRSPAGDDLEWDAEITEDAPNSTIAWRSAEGSPFPNWGRVRFEPGPGAHGTIVRLLMNYDASAHTAGMLWTSILGADPGLRVRRDLLRFKQLLETGEIATTEGQPAGRRSGANWLDRAVRI